MNKIGPESRMSGNQRFIKIFLAGDVMTGRGIDQILLHPSESGLYEYYVKDARRYIELAEKVNGPVSRFREPSYIWGDALAELEKQAPDVRIINLETSVTRSNDYWKRKEVHYRMSPENIDSITTATIDVCSLANNHILDWGYEGLQETLTTLEKAKIKSVGAGMNVKEAVSPAIAEIGEKGRVIVIAYGSPTAGIGLNWRATESTPGISLLPDFSEDTVRHIQESIRAIKKVHDVLVFSVHWGANWGYETTREERQFAHRLIESGVDIIYGHSSHHIKGIEIYHDRPIFYGCGDLLNDYEGIPGYEDYRGDLGLMYFPSLDPATGRLVELMMVPIRIKYLRVNRASAEEAVVLADALNREGNKFGTEIELGDDNILTLVPRKSLERSNSAHP